MIFYSAFSRLFNRRRGEEVEQPYDGQEIEKPQITIDVNVCYSRPFLQVYLTQGRIANFLITVDGKPYTNYFPDVGPGEHDVYVEATDMDGNRLTKRETIPVK